MAMLIYGRETWDNYDVSLFKLIVWQAAIWLPWILVLPLMERLFEMFDLSSALQTRLLWCGVCLTLLTIHIGWLIGLSIQFSPLNHLPNTRYGVYPYFFIFYAMIDLVLMWAVSLRLGIKDALAADIPETPAKTIAIKEGSEITLVPVSEINWVGAEDYYAKLYTNMGHYLLREPLKILVKRLPKESFVQIHRSTIVRTDFIAKKEANQLILRDNTVRPISRAGLKRLSVSINS